MIAAGTLLTSRMVVPPRSLVMGRPGKVVRELEPNERKLSMTGVAHYLELSRVYRALPPTPAH